MALPGEPKRSPAYDAWRFRRAPAWEGPIALRLGRLAAMAVGGWFRAAGQVRTVARSGAAAPLLADRLRTWNRLLPYVGLPFDVAYFPWNSAAIEHLGLFDFGRPVVISCRGSQIHVAPQDPENGRLREGLRETFAKAAVVHCVSEATLREAMRWGLDPARARVIRPAVDPEAFRPPSTPPAQDGILKVVTTGSLVGVKGYEYALLALRRLVDRGVAVRFSIIGEGPERVRATYTIRDLGLEGHVQLLGRRSPEDVRAELQKADAFLLSSLSEGISNAALEAMACGLPVVTTACGGMAEAVSDGVEGFVVPIRDSDAMAHALERLASDVPRRRRMGLAARERVVRDFDLGNQVGQFEALLEGAAG